MPCAIVAHLSLCFSFLSFGLFYGPDLDPMVSITIRTPWPTSRGLVLPYLHVYACLLLYFMLVLAFLALGFAMFSALRRLNLVWLHPTPMRPCSDVTIWDASPDVESLRPYPSLFSAPHDAMLTMLVYATHWLSVHLYTLAYMSKIPLKS